MSGKAPPKGPRALGASRPASSASATSPILAPPSPLAAPPPLPSSLPTPTASRQQRAVPSAVPLLKPLPLAAGAPTPRTSVSANGWLSHSPLYAVPLTAPPADTSANVDPSALLDLNQRSRPFSLKLNGKLSVANNAFKPSLASAPRPPSHSPPPEPPAPPPPADPAPSVPPPPPSEPAPSPPPPPPSSPPPSPPPPPPPYPALSTLPPPPPRLTSAAPKPPPPPTEPPPELPSPPPSPRPPSPTHAAPPPPPVAPPPPSPPPRTRPPSPAFRHPLPPKPVSRASTPQPRHVRTASPVPSSKRAGTPSRFTIGLTAVEAVPSNASLNSHALPTEPSSSNAHTSPAPLADVGLIWPPPRDPTKKDFRVVYDPRIDRAEARTRGKELVYRYNGERPEGEPSTIVRDPRLSRRDGRTVSKARQEVYVLRYEYDSNSTGPPPPTAVLITGLSILTPTAFIKRHFARYGNLQSFDPQIDHVTGTPLGVCWIKFDTHEIAKQCARQEHGKRFGVSVEAQAIRVELDGEGKRLKAVLGAHSKAKREANIRKAEEERKAKISASSAKTDLPPSEQSEHKQKQQQLPTPSASSTSSAGASLSKSTHKSPHKYRPRPPAQSLVRAREEAADKSSNQLGRDNVANAYAQRHSRLAAVAATEHAPTPPRRSLSRSPSPDMPQSMPFGKGKQRAADEINSTLAENGYDHIRVEGAGGSVREDELRAFFCNFKVDKILQDSHGWYVTFFNQTDARRASIALDNRQLQRYSVTLSVHKAPAAARKTQYDAAELVALARDIIIKDLRTALTKDVRDRTVGLAVRQLVDERRPSRAAPKTIGLALGLSVTGVLAPGKRLGGLSFKKRERPSAVTSAKDEEQKEHEVRPPAKKRRVNVDWSSSDEEDDATLAGTGSKTDSTLKRSAEQDDEVAPSPKRPRTDEVNIDDDPMDEDETVVQAPSKSRKKRPVVKKKPKKATRRGKATTKGVQEDEGAVANAEVIEGALTSEDERTEQVDAPSVKGSPPGSPRTALVKPVKPVQPPPPAVEEPVGPVESGFVEDAEDMWLFKTLLSKHLPQSARPTDVRDAPSPPAAIPDDPPPFRVHATGGARTEGYYKIPHSAKAAYVAQYSERAADPKASAVDTHTQQSAAATSRSARASGRRQAQGFEQINKALAETGAAAADLIKFNFNQLQTRKKQLRFARSPIHDWGLYAMERISRGEMVIEYVGEVIRAQVADKREKAYERQGIGSSYLFRIDDDLVVDATKKGNLGRLINHSCDPNCTAKIITISGEKKIVIYAKQDIELGDEITYDYHFPIEQEKIPCLCGSAKCRGFLN